MNAQQRLSEAMSRHSQHFNASDLPDAIDGHEQEILDAVRLRDDARVGRLVRHAIGSYVRRCALREVTS